MFHRLMMIAGVVSFLVAACTAYQTGRQPMNRAQVDSIQKGGTTRAQIDAMFGPPTSVAIVDNRGGSGNLHSGLSGVSA